MIFVLLLANIHSISDRPIVRCRRKQPKQETGDSTAMQISPSTTYDQIDTLQPDILYGEIQRAPGVNDLYANGLYANVTPKNQYEDHDTVIYSELQRND